MPGFIFPSSATEYIISLGVPKMKSKIFDYFNVRPYRSAYYGSQKGGSGVEEGGDRGSNRS
jgi:hypothetical protein